jgi:hypothetical protein
VQHPSPDEKVDDMNARHCGIVLLPILLLLAPACAQRTRVNTVPEGVTVIFEGNEIGKTPDLVLYTRSGWMRDYVLELRKPGYKPRKHILSASYHADESLFLAIFGILPYFFSARLEKTYEFSLSDLEPEEAAPAESRAPEDATTTPR